MSSHSDKSWKYILYLGVGSSLTIFSLLLWNIWRTSDRLFTTLTNLFNPPSPKLVIDNSAVVLEKIQGIQELTTTVYRMETVVPTSADRVLGKDWVIGRTKLLYMARGEVKAGIDLAKLEQEDIIVSPDKIAIVLPAAEILDSKIDVNTSNVYYYDRGFLNLGPDIAPQLQILAQQKTLDKIIDTACNQGILEEADAKAKAAIIEFLTLTNQKAIEVAINNNSSQVCQIRD
ncbi:MAG: DUF4230 domain-containing protein [Xenococcaceae cyanobacterium MO_188.B19]|nr:DUF4230 domain-containing protein [Xenococcaceae cyanobacterium MO_188.B19]